MSQPLMSHAIAYTHQPPTVQEVARRYVQWRDEDVGLLLTDLEQPGHYEKWKENKSSYSKRVADEVFSKLMYHEAIKFKVRWLESRFRRLDDQLRAITNEQTRADTKSKLLKEFRYYDRCKNIFSVDSTDTGDADDSSSKPETDAEKTTQLTTSFTLPFGVPSETVETIPTSDPMMVNTPVPNSQATTRQSTPYGIIHPETSRTQLNTSHAVPSKRKKSQRSVENMEEERRLKYVELELESKRMEHDERMQGMKLEQLRLEIELQKLKSGTSLD
ncbi:hypothetical protein PHYBLDRAFT_169291 [Phycomyces blakesleeanus NRRL 1555(-)]|uniref:Uncharacterized protein n=1 Tax=Phycomyces blakesleeanus (strain ATCC 8743b / DSM 1359 / FGSC 10004 / NBRC 33097 / NRRL 1555) TaxID=763407 RepID=A0A162U2V5_PHYB8|nr:hypothetical protein PHYBLDRAFT_169291 [Phycomyces blakesleeanus NRRL 1555(-)]OAD73032.1 hypothetical protein PHYBLDRAFT_169291 [Phycomyces blakesleeanus NRRL 1555(-)]|eukprot:XP_018291072.1 hypothetical protein PHYBLDRAFT_169291 [Phycomyces blakesleeanus NRRL 1555(-)]